MVVTNDHGVVFLKYYLDIGTQIPHTNMFVIVGILFQISCNIVLLSVLF